MAASRKNLNFILGVLTFLILPAFASVDEMLDALTLSDCYKLALKQSESVAIHGEMMKEAEGRFLQSLSAALPKISFVASEKRQDGSDSGSFTLKEVPEYKFTFSQPLFSGFKEFAAIAGSRAEKRQRLNEEARAKQLLFTDVSDAFYLLLGYQEDLASLQGIHAALVERVDELKKREVIGRSRPSEIASAEARLSRLEADIELVRSQEEVARELLNFLTGKKITNIVDEPLPAPRPASPDQYTPKAQNRPDVLAAKEARQAALKEVTAAQSGLWPKASLDGNYYTKRVGASQDVDWDFTFRVDVPLFEGFNTFGQTKEARAKEKQAQLQWNQTLRNASLEIQNTYTRLQAAYRRYEALEKALRAAEKNYQLQKQDYQFNLVNNLEVLQSLEDLQNAQRDFIAVKNETKRSYWNFWVAAGDIPL